MPIRPKVKPIFFQLMVGKEKKKKEMKREKKGGCGIEKCNCDDNNGGGKNKSGGYITLARNASNLNVTHAPFSRYI